VPGRHHGEAAERLPQLSRYSSEISLSGLLLLPQMRFSPWSPAPIPASLRRLIPCSAYSQELCCRGAAGTGVWPGCREVEEEVSHLQGEAIRAAKSMDQLYPPQKSCKAAFCPAWDPARHGASHCEDGHVCQHRVCSDHLEPPPRLVLSRPLSRRD